MDPTMSGMLGTVPVTSRSAYIFLSAGSTFPLCAMTATPMSRTCSRKASGSSTTLKPGIDSSLSTVPPV